MSRRMQQSLIATASVVALILTALLLRRSERYPTTDNAYVEADVVHVVARVSGPIVDLPIADNQRLEARRTARRTRMSISCIVIDRPPGCPKIGTSPDSGTAQRLSRSSARARV